MGCLGWVAGWFAGVMSAKRMVEGEGESWGCGLEGRGYVRVFFGIPLLCCTSHFEGKGHSSLACVTLCDWV
jgi:hypothetical protein